MPCDYTRIKNKFVLSRVNLCDVSQLLRHSDDRKINPFVGCTARTGNPTCAGCATIRRLMKCPGRVILRQHNGASSGSSRIISLGCVRAANNSLLFPASGTNASLMMTRRKRRSRRIAEMFARSFRTVCQLPRQASVDTDASACRRDRAALSHEYARSVTSISSPSRLEINHLRARSPSFFYTEIVKRVQSWCVTRCI